MHNKLSATDYILSVLVILFAFFFPHFGIIPVMFGYTIPVLLLIWLALKRTNESFTSLGFSFRRIGLKPLLIGAVSGIILFAFLNYALFPLINKVVALPKPDLKDFSNIRHHLANYLFITALAWIVGGIYEEIVFHGYIFTRLEKMMGSTYALPISFLLTNIIFALYHIQLGVSGMLNAFFCGCAYHALMLRFGRNMWYATFCHAVFDTIALGFIYLGYW